ncbi:hypothetical protein [Sorangium sp. So ce513]|uniref:hypothetical protein n=1 Tax=Sorangium sp. So ce513 TaxID=3133315 RepID=UPI003F62C2EF
MSLHLRARGPLNSRGYAHTAAPGRGGDSIGIAYLDDGQLAPEGVTYELRPPGKGGVSWDWSRNVIAGEDGTAGETFRFRE